MDKILYFHGKTTDNRRFTIAGVVKRDDTHVELGVSLCSAKDSFVKRVGRAKAYGRLLSKSTRGQNYFMLKDTNFVIKQFLDYSSAYNKMDSRVLQYDFNLLQSTFTLE